MNYEEEKKGNEVSEKGEEKVVQKVKKEEITKQRKQTKGKRKEAKEKSKKNKEIKKKEERSSLSPTISKGYSRRGSTHLEVCRGTSRGYARVRSSQWLGGEREKPSLSEVESEVKLNGYIVDPSCFYSYYEATGWLVGEKPMFSWRDMLKLWNNRALSGKHYAYNGVPAREQRRAKSPNDEIIKQTYTQEEISRVFVNIEDIDLENIDI